MNAARADASPNLGPLLVELAELRTELGLPREAEPLLDEASQLGDVSRELIDRIDAARLSSLSCVGDELRDRGELLEALARYETALTIARRLDDPDAKATLAFEVARCLHLSGNPEEAAPWFEEAKRRCEECEDHDGAAVCVWLSAEMRRRLGDNEGARPLYEDAAARFEAAGSHMNEHLASCLRSLGRVCRFTGDDAAALPSFERALSMARARGDVVAEGWALLELGWLKNDANERFHANARFLEADQRFLAAGEKEGRFYAQEGLSEIAFKDDRNEEAVAHATQAIALCEEADTPDACCSALMIRACAHHDLHQHLDSSADHWRAARLCRASGDWSGWRSNVKHAIGERWILAVGHRIGWLDGTPRMRMPSPLFLIVFGLLGFAVGLISSNWGTHPGRAFLPLAFLACALITLRVFRWLSNK